MKKWLLFVGVVLFLAAAIIIQHTASAAGTTTPAAPGQPQVTVVACNR